MRQWLRASVIYIGQCVQAALLYRSALAIFLISEAFATAGFIAFWYKSAQSNPQQTFYRPMGLVLYFALVTFHHGIQHHAASRELGSDIRLGKLSCSLIRPAAKCPSLEAFWHRRTRQCRAGSSSMSSS